MFCFCYIFKGFFVKWYVDVFIINGRKLFIGFFFLFILLLKNKNFWKNKMICLSVREIEKYMWIIVKKCRVFLVF